MEDKYVVCEYNEKASPQYRGCRYMTAYDPDNKISNDKIKVIAVDVTYGEAQKLITEVLDKNTNAFLNSMPDSLRSDEIDNFVKLICRWN